MSDGPLRIGILGAARIAPMALIKPAQRNLEAAVVGVAARDATRAASFAARHGIERVYTGYDELLADPAIEAVYNPLPNSHHARSIWLAISDDSWRALLSSPRACSK
jgi:predicted dehydrogenase